MNNRVIKNEKKYTEMTRSIIRYMTDIGCEYLDIQKVWSWSYYDTLRFYNNALPENYK